MLSGWNKKVLSACFNESARVSLCTPRFIVAERGSNTAIILLFAGPYYVGHPKLVQLQGWVMCKIVVDRHARDFPF